MDWHVVKTVGTRFEAEIVVARLFDAGIPARYQADDVSGWVPELARLRGVRVLVPEDSLQEAESVLQSGPPGLTDPTE